MGSRGKPTPHSGRESHRAREPFKIAMVAIVFAFSLSLFDVFELGVPSQVGEFASVKREGMRDAFFKGIMATLLATPCSGPFLGSTLAWAVTQTPQVIFAVFMMVKQMNRLKKQEEAAPAAPPAPSNEEVLLTQIRDLLKK